MKQCKKCNFAKDESLFPKRGNDCKECVAKYMKQYRTGHAKHIKAIKKQWKLNNAEHVKAKDKAYALANPDKRAIARKKWAEANPIANQDAKNRYSAKNPEKVKFSSINWRKNNPEFIRARDAKRRAIRKQALPKWLDVEDMWVIKEIYDLAIQRSKLHGFAWHVDHIIPLQHNLVCGLHVPENLQVIPAKENLRKSNTYRVVYA